MANAKTINGTVSKNNYEFYVELSESWSSDYSQTNKTTVSYAVYIKNHGTRTNSGHWTFSASYDGVSLYNATEQSVVTNDVSADGGVKQLFSGSFDVTHNDNGSKTIAFSASITKSSPTSYDPGNCYISGNYVLTNIPRYATVTSSYSNVTETSAKISWSSDANIETAQYRLIVDGTTGSWVNAQTNLNTKTGNYTITGLTANKSYKIEFDYKRKDSGLWSYSAGKTNSVSFKTYQYPYLKSIGTSDLNVGASTLTQTFKLYNPLKRNATIYMKLANNTVINCGSTTNGTDVAYTYTFTTANKNAMNSSITDTTLTKNATYYCTYSSQTVSTVSGKYHINSTDTNYKPTFSTSNWSYTTNYVKNDTVVANKSTITVNVSTSATPKTGATITGYTIKWGNQTKDIDGTTGSETTGTDSATTLKVIANDSRGFTTETSITIPVIAYTDPTCVIDADRTDGVGTDVFLSLDGTYKVVQLYTNSTTKEDNTILSIKYAISTTTSYEDDDYTIPISSVTINNGSYSLNNYHIYSDGSSAGFTVGTRYNIRIKVQDIYQIKEFYGTITDGKIAVDCYQDSNGDYHRGINGLGSDDYTQVIHGNEYVEGKLQYGSGGREDYHANGFTYDTYGNMKHKSTVTNNYWHIDANDGTAQFRFYPETGVATVGKSLQIPKNSGAGYGLCNSDGVSIIRDHANQNVTVDATGRILFLGYQDTTGINILNGKANVDSNGIFTATNIQGNGTTWIALQTTNGNNLKRLQLNSNGNVTLYSSSNGGSSWTDDPLVKKSEMYFQPNETWTIDEWYGGAYITSSTTTIKFTIPLPKRKGSTTGVSITGGKLNIRASTGGYLENGLVLPNAKATVKFYRDGYVTIYITNSTAYSTTNNTPVGIELDNLTLKFT